MKNIITNHLITMDLLNEEIVKVSGQRNYLPIREYPSTAKTSFTFPFAQVSHWGVNHNEEEGSHSAVFNVYGITGQLLISLRDQKPYIFSLETAFSNVMNNWYQQQTPKTT